MGKVVSTLQAWWSKYRPAHPFVVLRTASWKFLPNGRQALAERAEEELVAAAAAIRRRHGGQVMFRIYVVSSYPVERYMLSARRLAELLPNQADQTVRCEAMLLSDFLERVPLEEDVVVVVVCNKPSVERLLDDIGQPYALAVHGEPHFVGVARAKRPDLDWPRFKLVPDST
jgi:hypothetical protein